MKSGASRRRKERAEVFHRLKGIFLESQAISSKKLRIVNISELGMGLEVGSISSSITEGRPIEGEISVGYTAAPVRFQLVHKGQKLAGFEFIQISDLLKSAIRVYLEPEMVGASLKKIQSPASAQFLQDKEGNRLEIFFNEKEHLIKFSLSVLGNQIKWEEGREIVLIQNETSHPLPADFRKQMVNLFENVRDLNSSYRRKILDLLRFTDQA